MQPSERIYTQTEIDAERQQQQRDSREKQIAEYKLLNFGQRYREASLCKLEGNPLALEKIHNWMKNPQNMLIYHGTAGIGKTYLCAALTEWCFKKFDNFFYWKEEELLRKLRLGISEGKGDYLESLRHMIDHDIVILDDVGSGINPEKSSYRDLEFRREVFFSFLDYRYNSMKPTIITSNFSKEDFEQVYSKRITSRLFSSENLDIEIMDGIDKRSLGY